VAVAARALHPVAAVEAAAASRAAVAAPRRRRRGSLGGSPQPRRVCVGEPVCWPRRSAGRGSSREGCWPLFLQLSRPSYATDRVAQATAPRVAVKPSCLSYLASVLTGFITPGGVKGAIGGGVPITIRKKLGEVAHHHVDHKERQCRAHSLAQSCTYQSQTTRNENIGDSDARARSENDGPLLSPPSEAYLFWLVLEATRVRLDNVHKVQLEADLCRRQRREDGNSTSAFEPAGTGISVAEGVATALTGKISSQLNCIEEQVHPQLTGATPAALQHTNKAHFCKPPAQRTESFASTAQLIFFFPSVARTKHLAPTCRRHQHGRQRRKSCHQKSGHSPNSRGQPQSLANAHTLHGFLGPWRSLRSTPRFGRRPHRQTVPPDSRRPTVFALPPPLGGGFNGPL